MASTFYAQQSANRRNSVILAAVVVLLLGALGFTLLRPAAVPLPSGQALLALDAALPKAR